MDEKQFEIKITGSGTIEEIYTSIFNLQESIGEYVRNGLGVKTKVTLENPTLYCEISNMEE